MKKVWFTICMVLAGLAGQAQLVRRPAPQWKEKERPVNIPNQMPAYYQGNASYINNSMQNNKPATPNAGPYTGNGDYVNPARSTPSPAIINYNTNQLPAPAPIYIAPNSAPGTAPNTNGSNPNIDRK